MAGEIATAYVALVPSMRNFGSQAARQIGPQARAVGTKAGQQAGAAFSTAASKESAGWFAQTAKGAIKNVALYGSMYAAIQGVQRGIGAVLESMVGFNAEIEQASIGFETLLGSSQAAADQMQWIKDFARETPFQYKDLVGYSQQLLALGFNAEQSRDVLQATGDAAAALGRGSDSIARINLALGQMWTKGKVQSQEMLQLTEAGIGSWQILADAYGTSVEKVQKAVTKGLIKSKDAVPALLEGMNTRFGGLMEKQSQTFTGTLSNIQDTLQQQLAKAGEPLFGALEKEAKEFLDALDDPEVVKMMEDLGKMLADAVDLLSSAGKFAYKFRDAILAVGIAFATSKLLSRVGTGTILSPATWFSATRGMEAYRAGLTKTTALRAGLTERGMEGLKAGSQIAGLAGLVVGYQQVSNAQGDAAKTALGFAEAVGGGALAGAAMAGPVGAAAGAVVGLTAALWSYSQAAQAANKDTTAVQKAMQDLGVDAGLAQVSLTGLTNKQIDAAGGATALLDAMRSGTFEEYRANLEKQAAAADKARDAAYELARAKGLDVGWDALPAGMQEAIDKAELLDGALENLTNNAGAFSESQAQVTATAYQAAFAMDMQTGSLGTMTQAAWDAVVAQGGLGAEALYASARMEGMAGVAGYATQMLAGIPANTPINFSTNASEILQKIIALRTAVGDNANLMAATEGRRKELEAQLNKTLKAATVTMKLPTGGGAKKTGGGGGRKPTGKSKAQIAAEKAAAKLKRDRGAQRDFSDAFTSLMEAALEGDWDEYRDRLAEQIKQLSEDGYKKAAKILKEQSKALTKAAKDYAFLTNKLEAAQDAYDDLTQSMTDQYNTSRDLILGLGQVTDAQSFDQLAYLLGETTTKATEYQATLAALKASGLNEDLWNQLAQAGPESAALAESILAQGQAGIDQLNSLSDGLVGAAENMGSLVSNEMYAQGVDAMKQYIEGLKSQATALENQMEIIANNVLKKTGVAITPGTSNLTPISTNPTQQVNEFNLSISADSLGDLKSIQDFIKLLEQQPTTQLVNQAGTVTS